MKLILDFLQELSENNNRDWFIANRKKYDEATGSFKKMIEPVLLKMKSVDETLAGLELKNCFFRINRDVRFSKNKDPYKINFSANFSPGGKKSGKASYYIHIQPSASFIAAGVWMPEPIILKAIRQEIYFNADEFVGILENKDLTKRFGALDQTDKLKNPPKDFDAQHSSIDLLKHKSYILSQNISNQMVLDKNFPKEIVSTFKTAVPFIGFLNRAIHELE